MYFHDIRAEINLDILVDNQVRIGRCFYPTVHLFNRMLYSQCIKIIGFKQLNIILCTCSEFVVREELKGYWSCDVPINDKEVVTILDAYQLKKYFFDHMANGVLQFVSYQKWDIKPFQQAINQCHEQKLIDEWLFKDKLFRSPNRQNFVSVYNIVDETSHRVYLILYDKNKVALKRHLAFVSDVLVFTVGWVSWNNTNDTIFFQFNGPQKIFSITINDILNEIPFNIPASTSEYFKK